MRFAGILPYEVKVSRVGNNLLFDFVMDQLTISNYFYTNAYKVERVEFGDGVLFNLPDLQLGTITADNLNGFSGDSILMGYEGNDNLIGGPGNDLINGGFGSDLMIGGSGNDLFVIENIGDIVIEDSNEGIDTIFSFVTYILPPHVENIILTGGNSINATGNNLNNILKGNHLSNTFYGGLGDDTYYVDSLDLVIENPNEGIDTIISTEDYVLPSNIENLTLLGSSNINGTGNNLNNILLGNSKNNILDGSSGIDTMIGGAGDDIYVVNHSNDKIIENLGEGIDTVRTFISWSLKANIENLVLLGASAINGPGNELNNIITGNVASNILDGGSEADTLIGGSGNDTYIIDNLDDLVVENFNEGIDTIKSSIDFKLPSNVENLTLTGINQLVAEGMN